VAAGDAARLAGLVKFEGQMDGGTVPVEVSGAAGRYRVTVAGEAHEVDAREAAEGIWSLLIGGRSYTADVTDEDGVLVVEVDGERYRIRMEEETRYIIRTRGGKAGAGGQVLKSPLPGKVTFIHAAVGQAVAPGDALVVVEAMKMENELKAQVRGVVTAVAVQVGQAVNAGDTLVVIE
jgi:biotin carboxyl carrier protein